MYLWLHNWTMYRRNLAKFNGYHWLIPNFLSLSLSLFLSFSLCLCVSLSELLHWCMITCRVAAPAATKYEHAGSLPRLISHSSLTHKHICNIKECARTHTHTHTKTNYYNMHTRARDEQGSIYTRCTLVHKHTDNNGSVQYGYWPHYPLYGASGQCGSFPLDKSSPDILHILLPSDVNFCTSLIPLCTFLVTS
jgi:hypothetical protein